MGIWDRLFGKKESNTITEADLLHAGVCPNCWGSQEYEGQFKAYVQDQTKSNINKDKEHQKAFIQQFVETNLTGITLKNDNGVKRCPRCKSSY